MNFLIMIITFFTFFIEAILHFNIGKGWSLSNITLFSLPNQEEIIPIAVILLFFSYLNSQIIDKLSAEPEPKLCLQKVK